MKKKQTFSLTLKETFINDMIFDATKHTKGFRAGLISNGTFTFDDISHYLLMKGLSEDFKDYLEKNKSSIMYEDINSTKIIIDEQELPFSDLPSKEELDKLEKLKKNKRWENR